MFFVKVEYWPTLMYCRNQCFALSFLLACVQILDFLSFHHLFGPWAIIIGDLMKDLGRFLVVLAIFVFGFSMHIVALNQPFKNYTPDDVRLLNKRSRKTQYFSDGKLSSVRLGTFFNFHSDIKAFRLTNFNEKLFEKVKPLSYVTTPGKFSSSPVLR